MSSQPGFMQELKTMLTRRKQEGSVLEQLTLRDSYGVFLNDARSLRPLVKIVYLDDVVVR